MITCPVCLCENDEFAITCRKCKGFLQNRVANLNLFETAWGVIESPRATFRQIALADHKNYSLFLFGLFGISLSFTGFWYFKLGGRFSTLLDLIIIALISGPVLGIALSILSAVLFHLLAKIIGGKAPFRTSLALLAYSLTPIILSLFLVLPIELLTFGMYLFTSNPHPYVLKPLSYVLLMGFDSFVSLWTIILVIVGSMIAHGLSFVKSFVVVLLLLVVLSSAFVLTSDSVARSL